MPNILRNLRINRVASVDKGAGEGVQIILMKRDFSAKERKDMAGSGKAMPDGSFPIANEEDLHNAIRLAGKAKDPAAAKKHIISRAKAMGLTSALPDDWKVSKMTTEEAELAKKITFEHKKDGTTRFWHQQDAEGEPDADESGIPNRLEPNKRNKRASSVLHRAVKALKKSLESIFDDAEDEQTDLLVKTMDEFETHVQSEVIASDNGEAATGAAPGNGEGGGVNKKESDMTEQEVKTLQKALETANAELAFLRLSSEEQAFAKALPEDKKGAFCAKDEKARKDEMAACAKAATEQVPESVKKALADAEEMRKSNETLAKRVAELELKDETAALTKRATEIGLGSADVETIRKARKGDVESVKALETRIGALSKQVKEAGLFKEMGNGSTVGGNAYDQINARAADLRKADPKLTQAQAFEKAYTDPANRELVAIYKRDKNASI